MIVLIRAGLARDSCYALLVLLAALVVTLCLWPLILPLPSVPFFVAIVLLARRGTGRLSLGVAASSALAIDLLLDPPLGVPSHPVPDLAVAATMILVALPVLRVNEQLRASERRRERERIAAERVIFAEEGVRRDVAELLYSRVQSRLVAIWTQLRLTRAAFDADPAHGKLLLDRLLDELEAVRQSDVRQASDLLYPSFIREGLGPAVVALVEEYEHFMPVHLSISTRLAQLDTPIRNRIPEPTRLVAFRIVQEALEEIRREGEGASADVELALDERGRLTIEVRGQRTGDDPAGAGLGDGLAGVDSWVLQVGGNWRVARDTSVGDVLTAWLPLHPYSETPGISEGA